MDNIEQQINKLSQRKIFIEEEYFNHNLPADEYQRLKQSIDANIHQKKQNLEDLRYNIQPYRDFIFRQIPLLEDLLIFYKSVPGKVKRRILSCIFFQKVCFEKQKHATPIYQPPVVVLLNINKVLLGSKKKQELKNQLLSTVAPPSGLEPETL